MVDSILSFSRTGLKDWLLQRVSAVVIFAYVSCLFGFYWVHPNLTFTQWTSFITQPVMGVFGLLMLFSLLIHAWVGMWTVLTDYVKCYCLRISLEVIVIFSLVGYFAWGIQILWRI